MLKKRIIPCLDIKDGRTVKGIHFESLRDAGDPVALAALYSSQGADELVFLDISATNEKRKTLADLVKNISREIFIPFTVGGGISSVDDAATLLHNGADKVSLNSAAIQDPQLITDIASRFGSQAVVVAIDIKQQEDAWMVFSHGGTKATGKHAVNWAKQVEAYGAGEILLTSMNNDGAKTGFATTITKLISETINIPVIASGGAGTKEHFQDIFSLPKVNAALAASVFHFGEILIPELKRFLQDKKIAIR